MTKLMRLAGAQQGSAQNLGVNYKSDLAVATTVLEDRGVLHCDGESPCIWAAFAIDTWTSHASLSREKMAEQTALFVGAADDHIART